MVEWSGYSGLDTPAPQVEAQSSLGGGSSDTLAIVEIVVGGSVLLGGAALLTRSGSAR